MLTRHLALLVGAACLLASLTARAQDPTENTGAGPARNFGSAGQLTFASENTLDIVHSSNEATSVTFGPAADYFIIDHLSIGGFIGFTFLNVHDSDTIKFGIGPRVGYYLPFTDMLGIWPKIGFSYAHTNMSVTVTDVMGVEHETSASNDAIALNLFAPIMMHPATHFFVGFGPFLDVDLSGDNRVTSYGLKLTIGGWLD